MKTIITLCAIAALTTAAGAAEPTRPTSTCDRACLYRVLDDYLAARDAHDARKVKWAAQVKNTENNVELRPDDGLWGTITARDAYEMRFADPQAGQVAIFGVVEETTTRSPYATRLKVVDGAVAEAETIVVRPEDAGIPFVTADIKAKPVWNEMLAPADRSGRQKMIDVANGYFDTLQLNDGKLHTQFTPDCDRREDGMQSTNNAQVGLNAANSGLGCSGQFELGWYRYDDRLRDRRFVVVDEERGIVLAAGFIDHEGRLGEYTLTNGTKRTSNYRRPHTYVLFEAFRIKGAKIQQVEAAFITVPYNMPSPWVRH
jgi:hypothetical protein